MPVKKSTESIVKSFTERAGLAYSEVLAVEYENSRDINRGECDRVVFARTLLRCNNLLGCKEFIRHPKNIKVMRQAREKRVQKRMRIR